MQVKTVSAVPALGNCSLSQKRDTYYFNNIRSFIVILVVVIHVALGYASASEKWWSVPDDHKTIIADITAGILDIFIMPVLFFVSGYFTQASFEKRTRRSFVVKKARALMVPWLFGFFCINPLFPIMTKLQRNIPLDIIPTEVIAYYRNLFVLPFSPLQPRGDSPFFFSHYHFWYLSLLFLFFFIYAVFGTMLRRVIDRLQINVKTGPVMVSALVVISSLGYYLLREYFSDSWFVLSAVQFQIARVVPHFCFFLFGIASTDTSSFAVSHRSDRFLSIALISLAVILSLVYLASSGGIENAGIISYLHSLLRYVICLIFLFGILTFAKAFAYKKNMYNSILNRYSFDVYSFHLIIVVMLQFFFAKTDTIGAAPKFFIVSILSIVFSYLLAILAASIKKVTIISRRPDSESPPTDGR